MSRSVAVVGSGPGGMYVVQGLVKNAPDVKIDVIERLPSPFGLIRGGVAPDHATTKNVSRAFEKALTHANVRYLGNVEVGRDVSVAELEEIYDAVVLAYGAPYDNQLGIPGEDKKNVFGSNAFVGWYNCHPDFRELNPDLEIETVAVIGAGNVAIDVARVLAKTPAEMAHTDLADHAAEIIHPSPIKHIWMFARRGPVEGAFTNVELREMGELKNCAPVIEHPEQIPADPDYSHLDERDARLKAKNVETLRSFIGAPTEGKARRLHFEFYASPVEILGGDTAEGIRLERMRPLGGGRVERTGDTFDVPCQMVVTCIGSRAARLGRRAVQRQEGHRAERRGQGARKALRRGLGEARRERDDRHQQDRLRRRGGARDRGVCRTRAAGPRRDRRAAREPRRGGTPARMDRLAGDRQGGNRRRDQARAAPQVRPRRRHAGGARPGPRGRIDAMAETAPPPDRPGEIAPEALRRRLTLAYATPVVAWPWPDTAARDEALAAAILAAEARGPSADNNLVGGWSSGKDLFSWTEPAVAELSQQVRALAGALTQATNVRAPEMAVRFRVEAWANVLRAGGYHNLHDHPNAVWSGVYYVRVPPPDAARPLAGAIEFVDPRQGADANSLPGSAFRERLRYQPKPGLMLLFPGWLKHLVHPVAGAGERISVSFNLFGAEVGRARQAAPRRSQTSTMTTN